MAEKKTTKKPVTKEAHEVKTVAQLQKEITTKRADLLTYRRSLAAGELVNPQVISQTRREVARLLTSLRVTQLTVDKETK